MFLSVLAIKTLNSRSKWIGDNRKTDAVFYHGTTVVDPHESRVSLVIIAIAWAGGTFATAILALLGNWQNIAMILGSFGASCLLIFIYPESPFTQPRNIVGGHLITTFVIIITASAMKICAILE